MLNTINSNDSIAVSVSSHSSTKSHTHYDVRSKIASHRAKSDGRYHSKRNLKAKAVMFQNGQMSRRAFIGEVSGLIMRAAIAMKCRSYDWRYDFYLYIISRIDKIMACYKPSDDFEFETWFVAFCKKRYISFIRLKKSKWISVSDASLSDIFSDSYSQTTNIKEPSYSYEMLDYSGLSDFEIEIVKARYGITDETTANDAPGVIRIARESEKSRLADLIAKKYAKLLDIRTKIGSADDEQIEMLRAKEQSILNRKRILESRYNGIKSTTSIRDLCNMYNISRFHLEQTLKNAETKLYRNNRLNYRAFEA